MSSTNAERYNHNAKMTPRIEEDSSDDTASVTGQKRKSREQGQRSEKKKRVGKGGREES